MPESTKQRRRREQDENDRDQAHYANERRNEPVALDEARRCHARLGGEHDFSMLGKASREPGCEGADFKVARCWYCTALSPFAQQRLDAFRREVAQSVERRAENAEAAGSTPALPAICKCPAGLCRCDHHHKLPKTGGGDPAGERGGQP